MKSTTWRQLGVGGALLCAGAAYFALRSESASTSSAKAEPAGRSLSVASSAASSAASVAASVSATALLPSSPQAGTPIASGPALAEPSPAPGPRFTLPPEQLQYRMRTVLQDQTLLKHQFQMEAWECRDDRCRATVRVPPSSEAGRRQDMSSAKDLLDVMRVEAKSANAEIALRSIVPGKQGIAIELDLTPAGREVGRYYTPAEIARIRAETVQQVSQSASQPQKP